MNKAKIYILALLLVVLAACSSKKTKDDAPEIAQQTDSQRIENLSSALSRSQSRIEELDARIGAIIDKMESMKLQLDNISGNKPLKVEKVAATFSNAPPHEKVAATFPTTFGKGMGLFKNAKYSDAIIEFNKFTEDYPEHILAGSAQYHVGESYYMMGQHKLAAPEYEKVVTTFASSPRVSSAMVRLAECQSHNGNTKEAASTAAIAKELYDGSPVLDSQKKDDLSLEPMNAEKVEH